jgi:hypothetical protein
MYRDRGNWTDKSTRHLLCELDDGGVRTYGYVFLGGNDRCLLELINDVIVHVVVGGSFMHIKKRGLVEQTIQSTFNSPTFANMYATISTSHLQTASICYCWDMYWHLLVLWLNYCGKGAWRSKYMSLTQTDRNRHSLWACVDKFCVWTAEFITWCKQPQEINDTIECLRQNFWSEVFKI